MPIFTQPSSSSPSPPYANHVYAAGKRPRREVDPDPEPYVTSQYAKRRKMITPRSAALSVVTPENDTSNASLTAFPLPPTQSQQPMRYDPPPYSSVTSYYNCNLLPYHQSNYHAPIPTNNNPSYAAPPRQISYPDNYLHPDYTPTQMIPPSPQPPLEVPLSSLPPGTYQHTPCNFSLQSPTYSQSPQSPQFDVSPSDSQQFCPSPDSPTLSFYSNSSAKRLRTDIGNSFATGDTGTISWTNGLLVRVLAYQLDQTCFMNQRDPLTAIPGPKSHLFFSQNKQPFNLDFYMARLVQYANCSTAAFVTMLIYIDRLQTICPELFLTEMNCHRIIITALVVAIKYLDDEVFSNTHYARVGGVTPQEMNQLELNFLDIVSWNLHVSPEDYAVYEDALINSTTAAIAAAPSSQASTSLSPQASPSTLSSPA